MKNESGVHPITRALTTVIRGICSHPDSLRVYERDLGSLLEVDYIPDAADIRVLIGKGWRQKNALSTLAAAMGRRMNITADFTISDAERGKNDGALSVPTNLSFDVEDAKPVLATLIDLAIGDVPWKAFRDGKTIRVEICAPESDATTVLAIGDLMWPYGIANGRKINVKFRQGKRTEVVK